MTYREAYQRVKTPQELIDMIRHDVLVWEQYGKNPARLQHIISAMNDAAKEKDWDPVRIKKCVEMRTGETLEVSEDADD